MDMMTAKEMAVCSAMTTVHSRGHWTVEMMVELLVGLMEKKKDSDSVDKLVELMEWKLVDLLGRVLANL